GGRGHGRSRLQIHARRRRDPGRSRDRRRDRLRHQPLRSRALRVVGVVSGRRAGGGSTMRLENKVAVVTAAASGMGLATAELFAREGASSVRADINEVVGAGVAAVIRRWGKRSHFVRTEVGEAGDIERLIERVLEEFGRIDVLYNGVSINMAKPITVCMLE